MRLSIIFGESLTEYVDRTGKHPLYSWNSYAIHVICTYIWIAYVYPHNKMIYYIVYILYVIYTHILSVIYILLYIYYRQYTQCMHVKSFSHTYMCVYMKSSFPKRVKHQSKNRVCNANAEFGNHVFEKHASYISIYGCIYICVCVKKVFLKQDI